ncbi:GH39 family glycosyl hydrolase [Paenibacillus glycanilyticus]|uniref:HTH araC/xylS-type domain-containing protein n=1 Tax=Paenibacillus glycanilyticus TaxID=126569 RepID=A0ABQ6GJD5_9BACL|nr:helix-turn-helix domain-containing protein [Paenibacillus glycanilyticus]GLX70948.1 hypothetical protein MU1_52960 [Paenibacillus glycanilyticus]
MRNSIYEMVETSDSLPFDVSLHSVNYVPSHWHNSLEMIFVLRGRLDVTVMNRQYPLSEGDVLLINDCHVHEVIGLGQNIIATFQIPAAYLNEHIRGIERFHFDCYSGSVGSEQRLALDRIRQYMAEMVQLKHKKSEVYVLEMQVKLLSIFSILMKQFKTPAVSGAMNEKYMERMLRIIRYMEEHYKEPITLQAIADSEFLSVPYLSKFFSENIGLNFQSYLTNIRLKNTVEDLLRYDEVPIADLALEHGFPNAKSFYAAFKAKYHVTPSEYRNQYRPELEIDQERTSANYFSFNQSNALGIINQYLQRGQSLKTADVRTLEQLNARIDVTAMSKPVRHTWKSLITIGKAKEGLHADVQEHLRMMQQTSPFRYLRFHGIFDDNMMVYQEDEHGEPYYNFRLIDQLFDFLRSIGLKPFVELGFMPLDMAADKSKTIFYRSSCVSPPKSMDRWGQLVDRFLRHCINRYGLQEVESWKFEFWNEPELQIFLPGTLEDYMEMYHQTYRVLKAISGNLQIGAPGRVITFESKELFDAFIAYCREKGCLPDFLPLHFYPHEDIDRLKWDNRDLGEWFKLQTYRQLVSEFMGISPNPDYLKDMLARERKLLEEYGLNDREQYLTEWNSTAYHRELTNDTMYKAAYIVKNIVDNLDSIDGFGYWVLSDNIEETAASSALFHGGLGLIAQYGIPKAGFFAYALLAKLGDRLIAQGNGYVVTQGRLGYQVLTYNYCHFDELYALGDTSFIDALNRYNGFKEDKTYKVELELAGIASGKYRVVTHTLNRENGSSYDLWLQLGAPESLTADDIQYLRTKTSPKRHVQEVELLENHIPLTSILEPHSVELIELIPIL